MHTIPIRRPSAVPAVVWRRRAVLCACLGSLLAVAAPAHAGDANQKTAVTLDPKVSGPIIPQDLALIEKAVQTALQEQNFAVVPKDERDSIASAGNLKSCYRNDCMEQLGRLLGAHLVLAYKIKVDIVEVPAPAPAPAPPPPDPRKRGRGPVEQQAEPAPADASPLNWEISASLYNIEVGAIGAKVEMKCEHCSGPQVAQNTADLVKRAVLEDASKARGQIEIVSTPANASVLFDGVELGVTPYKRTSFVGKHQVTVRHTGYKSMNQEITISDTQKLSVSYELEVGKDPIKYIQEYQPRPKWRLALGGTLIGVGVVGIALGGYALSLNGQCTNDALLPGGLCPTVYNSTPTGLGLIVGGVVVAGVGAVMMILPGKRNSLTPDQGTDTFGDKDKPTDKPPAPRAALSVGGMGSGVGLNLFGAF